MGLRHAPPYKIADLIPETTQRSIKLDEIRAPSYLPNPHEFPPSTGPTKKAKVTVGDQGKQFAGRGGVAFHENLLLQLRLREFLGLRLRTLVSAKPSVSGVFFFAFIWPTGIARILMFAPLHTPIVVGQEVEYPTFWVTSPKLMWFHAPTTNHSPSFPISCHHLSSTFIIIYNHL